MKRKRVLVVDDSAFMRKLITDFVNEDYRLEVVATARNGKDALDKVHKLKPDVITMDVEMPVMTGLEALIEIMKTSPTPVIMLSSNTAQGADTTVQAINHGAVDFLQKPSGPISLDLHKIKANLIQKLLSACDANLEVLKSTVSERDIPVKPMRIQDNYLSRSSFNQIICIGTSTGGPRALQEVLSSLPGNLAAPIVIVQHMPKGFTKSLADRLNTLTAITVKEAEAGEILQSGVAYIAPGGSHLAVKKTGRSYMTLLTDAPPESGHRPSVNTLFKSIAEDVDLQRISVIMTGMGADGAEGIKDLKRTGTTYAIAEAESTAVVYGMPKAAVQTGLVDEVTPLQQISSQIIKQLNQ